MKKRLVSAMVSTAMIFSCCPASFAMSSAQDLNEVKVFNVDNKIEVCVSKAKITEELEKIGFTKSEIEELYKKESMQKQIRSIRFPKNPDYGDTYTQTIKISNADLGLPSTVAGILSLSKKQIAKKIVGAVGSSSVLWAGMAAGAIIAYVNDKNGFSGFRVKIKYTYGITNDLDEGWTPGKTTIKCYK